MFGAPSIVSVVDPAAMITAIFIDQWLLGAVGDLSIHQWARSVKRLLPKETRACLPHTPNITPVDGTPWRVAGGGIDMSLRGSRERQVKITGCNLHSTQCSLDHLVRSDEAASPERT